MVVVKEAFEVLKIYPSGEFPGRRVLQNIREERNVFFPNLKRLVKYGILERKELSRGGKRAYYSIPDPEGVERAIKEIMPIR